MPDLHLYLHSPVAIFEGRVDMPGVITYPITEIVFDGVTTGAYTDIVADMTLLLGSAAGLDDYGRVRVQNIATSATIPIGRTSEGYEDGELTIVNDSYVTVLEDYRVWSKIPYIDGDGIQYKDTNVPVGDFGSEQPPVANCGPGFAGDIDSVTDVITVTFPPTGVSSFAVADGATIDTYAWDVGDGTITVGTSSDAQITVTFPAGFRYVALTITDSNGVSHTARCPVYARDPANDTTLQQYTIERHHIEQGGQELTLRIYDDLPRTTYPDGMLCMFWDGEALAATDRSNIQFIGWHQVDEAETRATRTGNLQGTTLNFVDVGGRLKTLPGFPQSLERAETVTNWDKMVNPTMDKYIHYILQWHSTALSLADYFPSDTGDDYPFVIFASSGDSLFDQVLNEARGLVPTHQFTVNRKGQLAVIVDPMLQDESARTSDFQGTFTEAFTENLRFAHTRPPRVHWLRGHALLTTTDYIDVDGTPTLPTLHCIAPGPAPGQGLNEVETNEGLARSQFALNSAKGHEYARLNARYGPIVLDKADDAAYNHVEPANLDWVGLQLSAENAAQRGFTFTNVRAQCKELDFRYQNTRSGIVRRSQFTLELETVGKPAITVIPAGSDYVPDESYVPPDFGDPGMFYGDMQGYVMWDGAHIYRTWNLLATSPVWQLIDAGVTGNIYDCQYVNTDANTIGAWLMTSTAIWWCDDIQAITPAWSAVLPIATVQAADAVPDSGVVQFKTMFHYWLQPGHLCVATGPADTSNNTYAHAYFWVTEDFGQNWTQVDMDAFLVTDSTFTRGYCYASLYDMAASRNTPTLWCVRSIAPVGLTRRTRVFRSDDLGYTWEQLERLADGPNNHHYHALLNPFPNNDDPSYAGSGDMGVSTPRWRLQVSHDGWETNSIISAPSGYAGLSNLWRANKRTFDNDHLIGWFRDNTTGNYHLLQTENGGSSWGLLYDSGLTEQSIPNIPNGAVSFCARHNTPNGWPADVDQWVIIRGSITSGFTNIVQLTLDNFATTPLDKSGNLPTLVSAWTNGPCDGFALTKVGVNAGEPPDTDSHVRVRVARASGNGVGSVSVASTGVVEGDTVLLHFRAFEDFAPTGVPSGFSLITNGEITGTNGIRVYSKVAGPSEPANYTFAYTAGLNGRVGLLALYPDGGGTIELDASANQSNASATTYTAPSVNTTQPYTFLTCFISTGSNQNSTAQLGMTKQYDTSASNGVHAMTLDTLPSVGASGTRTMSGTNTTSRAVTAAWKRVL